MNSANADGDSSLVPPQTDQPRKATHRDAETIMKISEPVALCTPNALQGKHDDDDNTSIGDNTSTADNTSTTTSGGSTHDDRSEEIERLQDVVASLTSRFEQLERQLHAAESRNRHGAWLDDLVDSNMEGMPHSPCYIDVTGACTWNRSGFVETTPMPYPLRAPEHIWTMYADSPMCEEAAAIAQAQAAETVLSELFGKHLQTAETQR
jgi:hypothetical protein